jgi:hypothetical protein
MSEEEREQPYAGPGRETDPREDMPEDHRDVEEFVDEVDEVKDERLETRIDETFENRAEES